MLTPEGCVKTSEKMQHLATQLALLCGGAPDLEVTCSSAPCHSPLSAPRPRPTVLITNPCAASDRVEGGVSWDFH